MRHSEANFLAQRGTIFFFFFDRQKLVLRSAKKMGAHPMHTSSVHKKTTQAPEKKEET